MLQVYGANFLNELLPDALCLFRCRETLSSLRFRDSDLCAMVLVRALRGRCNTSKQSFYNEHAKFLNILAKVKFSSQKIE